MILEKIEIEYLQEFLRITDKKGVYGLVTACENKQFSMVSLREIVEKVIDEELNPKMSKN